MRRQDKQPYRYETRIVACAQCGAPLEGAAGHVQLNCDYCQTLNTLSPRTDEAERQIAQLGAQVAEPERIGRLRAGESVPEPFPPALQHLLSDGRLPPPNVPAAQAQWLRARRELVQAIVPDAAERLYVLTQLLGGHFNLAAQHQQTRALIESALDHLRERRYRQVLYGMLVRNAARLGDVQAARKWLALCTPYSDDLPTDSAYRISLAYLATRENDYQVVVRALGVDPRSVPLEAGSVHLAMALRANALERLGRLQEAADQLSSFVVVPGGREALAFLISANKELRLCRESFALAVQQEADLAQRVVTSRSGITLWPVWLWVALLPLLLFGAPEVLNVFEHGAEVLVFIVPIIIGWSVGMTLLVGWALTAKLRARWRLRRVGVAGEARILSAKPTGSMINHQPVIQLLMHVQAASMRGVRVIHREILSPLNGPRIQPGAQLPVTVDPRDPRCLLIEWGQV